MSCIWFCKKKKRKVGRWKINFSKSRKLISQLNLHHCIESFISTLGCIQTKFGTTAKNAGSSTHFYLFLAAGKNITAQFSATAASHLPTIWHRHQHSKLNLMSHYGPCCELSNTPAAAQPPHNSAACYCTARFGCNLDHKAKLKDIIIIEEHWHRIQWSWPLERGV